MRSEFSTVDGMSSAADAAALMRQSGTSEVLVARRSPDDAWGMVTLTDLVKKVVMPGKDGQKVGVYEIMTKPVITVPADMDIRYAVRLMDRTFVRSAPVEDKGEIVGMITLASLVLEHELV